MNNPEWYSIIKSNVEAVTRTIADACDTSARKPDDVRLVGVTKYVGLAAIRALLEAGVYDLGESRVQQLVPRSENLGSNPSPLDESAVGPTPRWHMIGSLQRNKVKYLLPNIQIIHSVDSLRLAEQIQTVAEKHDTRVEITLEVNVSGESAKHGVTSAELPSILESINAMSHVAAKGLMTMAPYSDNPETARPHFAALRELLDEMRKKGAADSECRHLSMGMSGDYAVAVEEGATLVRIGSALFDGLSDEQRQAN